MKYVKARELIRSGDLLAFSHVGWKSWHDIKVQVVRMFTRSEYSHVGIAWVQGGRVFCLEAVVPEIRIFPLSKLGEFYWIPMGLNWTEELEDYALSLIGEKYSQLLAIASAFDQVPKGGKLWQCAKYVHAIYEKVGISLGELFTPTNIVHEALLLGNSSTLVVPNDPEPK